MQADWTCGQGYVRPPAALQFAGPNIKQYDVIVRAAVRWNPSNLEYLSEKQRADVKLAQIAVKSPFGRMNATPEPVPVMVLQHVAPELRDHAVLVKEAVMCSGYELQFASEKLREEKQIVAWACAPMQLKQLKTEHIKKYDERKRKGHSDVLNHELFEVGHELRDILWPGWAK